MIHFLLNLLNRFAQALEAAAAREQKKCEAKLKAAAALVSEANGHRSTTQRARKTASALKDIVAPQ
ncbi:hypothetical protein RSP795_10325 [Ralstonia solanacearum]|uniref:hypothetical protein n=1 Tax=Ralstonia solanacearum TaxID=305 RepID=UPI0007D8020D|nr:hypothetical protein [Ralstonia solanacearum]OAI62823.1 hypothetical protein RSP795_10325 [Ralstonia solanacearum]